MIVFSIETRPRHPDAHTLLKIITTIMRVSFKIEVLADENFILII